MGGSDDLTGNVIEYGFVIYGNLDVTKTVERKRWVIGLTIFVTFGVVDCPAHNIGVFRVIIVVKASLGSHIAAGLLPVMVIDHLAVFDINPGSSRSFQLQAFPASKVLSKIHQQGLTGRKQHAALKTGVRMHHIDFAVAVVSCTVSTLIHDNPFRPPLQIFPDHHGNTSPRANLTSKFRVSFDTAPATVVVIRFHPSLVNACVIDFAFPESGSLLNGGDAGCFPSAVGVDNHGAAVAVSNNQFRKIRIFVEDQFLRHTELNSRAVPPASGNNSGEDIFFAVFQHSSHIKGAVKLAVFHLRITRLQFFIQDLSVFLQAADPLTIDVAFINAQRGCIQSGPDDGQAFLRFKSSAVSRQIGAIFRPVIADGDPLCVAKGLILRQTCFKCGNDLVDFFAVLIFDLYSHNILRARFQRQTVAADADRSVGIYPTGVPHRSAAFTADRDAIGGLPCADDVGLHLPAECGVSIIDAHGCMQIVDAQIIDFRFPEGGQYTLICRSHRCLSFQIGVQTGGGAIPPPV